MATDERLQKRPLDLAPGTRWPGLAHGCGRPVHGPSCSLRKPGGYILEHAASLPARRRAMILCTCGLDASWLVARLSSLVLVLRYVVEASLVCATTNRTRRSVRKPKHCRS
jgi:hypothetical protein